MNASRTLASVAAVWLLATGCAGGSGAVDLKRLPASPIALLYRDESLAMQRIDAIHDLEKRNKPSDREGMVVRVETLDALFGGTPDAERKLAATAGHLAFFDPVEHEVEVLHGAPPGAKPLAWSPERDKLLLSGRFRDTVQLFTWERATGLFEIVSSGTSNHPMGCLGPGGRVVAAEARRISGNYEVRMLATPPGSSAGLRPVTPGPADVFPSCSPNSSLVAYVLVDDEGEFQVAVRDIDAPSEAPRVVARGTDPVFTPDGTWIVYSAIGARGNRLFRVRPDGAGRTPIGAGTTDETQPAVSPDGAYVAYVSREKESQRERLRVRRFDGTGDRPFLTSGDADAPVW
jgi:hypothetical protein